MSQLNWVSLTDIPSKVFVCGYCGNPLASQKGYTALAPRTTPPTKAYIYICHQCSKPTFFNHDNVQTPGSKFGQPIKHLNDEKVAKLYDEARSCFTIGAFTSTVMCCRKLLMNISVIEGAEEGLSFIDYVTYLESNNYVPPKGKAWVDSIRKLGNEANHSIEFKSSDDAKLILTFTEMLLRFIYEMPGLLNDSK